MVARDGAPDRDFLTSGTLHFMGIGGAGMCALAEAIVRGGGKVTGCDLAPAESVEGLERMGARVWPGHDPAHVDGAIALVVSSAIPADHPEIRAALESGIAVWKRARVLGEWVNRGQVVAVAGTHGKTTTTAMITDILVSHGLNPTGFVGGRVQGWGGHLRPGSDELFVVEADEYDRSFHFLKPSVAVVTNMEADHLDVYGDLAGLKAGFQEFLQALDADGTVLVCADDHGAASLVPALSGTRIRSFGFSAGSQLRGIRFVTDGAGSLVHMLEDGIDRGSVRLRLAGRHNALNALAAASAARAVGVDWSPIRSSLESFQGVARRFQSLGEIDGVQVVDDYAHHPSEIEAALKAARESFPGARLVAVFQPHLYTRTRDFVREFAQSLASADVAWLTDVYPARERPIPGVDGELVAREVEEAVDRRGHSADEVYFHAELDSLASELVPNLRPGDLCLILGAGTIERLGPEVVEALRQRERRSRSA